MLSQVGAPSPPITPHSLRENTLTSPSFWILVAGVLLGLLVFYFGFHERYAKVTCWIYLAESSLVSTFTVVSARCFASFLPPPMPGKLHYFYRAPDCFYTWGALAVLCVSAVCGLLLQNQALMYFKASEVVPIYFCMFALSGVAGSGLAYGELQMPWVLMLFPGVAFCILGVFAISHRRDERIARRHARREGSRLYDPPVGGSDGSGGVAGGGGASLDGNRSRRESHDGAEAAWRGLGSLGPESAGLAGAGAPTRGLSAIEAAARGSIEQSRGVSILSEACSQYSVQSAASLEEHAFMALGGGTFSSFTSSHRMANPACSASNPNSPPRSFSHESSTASLRDVPAQLPAQILGSGSLGGRSLVAHHADTGVGTVREALLPRCSEASSSASGADAIPGTRTSRASES